ncbi:TetR/AcrR family transcriptional repressor of mexJK operon [Natronocella acetinitrilica]|uniref:TetR/AcrR family transcriptional repressor of mexJK operon n=1 Tax=Natronocella acetinitrilica TaxID=414046 RepID=A0AAE3G7T9_9GAMM|nr:TetR/AcrR family transcriptional regulator [Natronocella acetinitrilica]MCP1675372.1 TetR/AcrR family transcriptional repressor of mexJK operon [Natronocella acetinitrilica]
MTRKTHSTANSPNRRRAGRPKDADKRDAVLAAAVRLFFQHGFDGVSVEAVAREAHVSKVTVYGHFGDKESLFREAISRETAQMRRSISQLPEDAEGLRSTLIGIGMGMMRFLMRPEVLAVERVIAVQGQQHPELVQAFFEAGPWAVCNWLCQQLEALQRQGLLVMPDILSASDQLVGMWQGMLIKELRMGIRPVPDEEALHAHVSAAVDTFLRAYGAQSAARK